MNQNTVTAPVRFSSPATPIYNKWPGTCAACKKHVDSKGGQLVENPLRVVCALCLLRDGVREDGLRQRLEAFPKRVKLADGTEKELNPLPFQVEDAWRTHTTRALLLAQQPGCGKTIVSAMGALRTDMLNIVFCPASVRENWKKEVSLWRPDLTTQIIQNQEGFATDIAIAQDRNLRGIALVGSYGAMPGSACPGCRNLRARLKKLKKEKRYHGELPPPCVHFGPESPHQDEIELVIDGEPQVLPYSLRKGAARWQLNPLPEVVRPLVLLADECHALKTESAQRTQNFRGFRERVWIAGGHVYGLSGTPCEGKPGEYWEVLRSLGLERAAFGNWENYHRIFADWFDNPKGERRPPEGELRRELHARLRPIQILRRRKDVLAQLPPRIEEVIEVDIDRATVNAVDEACHRLLAVRHAWEDVLVGSGGLGPILNPFDFHLEPEDRVERRARYEERVSQYFDARPWVEVDAELGEAVRGALMSKGRMPTLEELAKIRAMLSQAKLAAVTDWISHREEEEEPVALFSQHVGVLKKITEKRPGWALYYGGLTAKQRFNLVERFQSGQIARGLALSIGAGGEGITLTRARVCAFVDQNWNPSKNHQAESRLIRIGAERHESIVVVKFVANHCVDQLVVETLEEKAKLLEAFDYSEDHEQEWVARSPQAQGTCD